MKKVKDFLVQVSIIFFLVFPNVVLLLSYSGEIIWFEYIIIIFFGAILSGWIQEKVK